MYQKTYTNKNNEIKFYFRVLVYSEISIFRTSKEDKKLVWKIAQGVKSKVQYSTEGKRNRP